MAGVIGDRFRPLPPPLDEAAAQATLAELAEAGHPVATLAAEDAQVRNLLLATFGGSPFLTRIIRNEPDFTAACFSTDSTALFSQIIAGVNQSATLSSQKELMRQLRVMRRRMALLVALADMARAWPLMEVTRHLTAFADAAVQACLAFLLRQAAERGEVDDTDPAHSGLVVFQMGKGGAGELNYSSDVDLIFLFDAERAALAAGVEPQTFFVRLVRRAVQILSEITEDGQVMRVDLRLRPDPGSTPVALSAEAALAYYFSIGQTWERAAWIKARPCAGDVVLGEQFLQELSPWIWRKYLDYAAIAEVQALKRRIHAVKGHGEITIPGHDLKLGRGGIREIEFFVQTQQLIAGGRHPALRGRQTLAMLRELAAGGWVEWQVAEELSAAYERLRTWEHRLQMMNDLQTHTLPREDEALERLARFAGFADAQALRSTVQQTLECVQGHYDALFSEAAGETATGRDDGEARLVDALLAEEPDAAALDWLAQLGLRNAEGAAKLVRGWFSGRCAALRSDDARRRLQALLPRLLREMAQTDEPEAALAAFDRFVCGLPSGVQLFALLQANPHLLELLLLILGSAPVLAGELTKRPRLFAALIEGDLTGPMASRAQHQEALQRFAPLKLPFEEVLDRTRILVSEQKFIIGTRLLAQTADIEEAEAAYTALAEAALAHMLDACRTEMMRRHGVVPGAASAILALGKLGSGEMTHTSDLDLVIIHDFTPDATASEPTPEQKAAAAHIRPLAPAVWFTRLTRLLISALTAPTAEGVLYEVDMRLRPSGTQGPVATHIESFSRYHAEEAWLWEHLALTRGRVVAGDEALAGRVEEVISATICKPHDPAQVRSAVRDMRRRILAEKPAASAWDIKSGEGGLVDVEFCAQALVLMHAHAVPSVWQRNTVRSLQALIRAGLLQPAHGDILLRAAMLWHRLMHVQRLCLKPGEKPREDIAGAGLARVLAQAAQAPDLSRAREYIAEMRAQVADVFAVLMEEDGGPETQQAAP